MTAAFATVRCCAGDSGPARGSSALLVPAADPRRRREDRSHSVGAHFPLFVTSGGLCLAASLDDAALSALIGRYPAVRFSNDTMTQPAALLAHVRSTREMGYAVSELQLDERVRGIAMPVRDAGQMK